MDTAVETPDPFDFAMDPDWLLWFGDGVPTLADLSDADRGTGRKRRADPRPRHPLGSPRAPARLAARGSRA